MSSKYTLIYSYDMKLTGNTRRNIFSGIASKLIEDYTHSRIVLSPNEIYTGGNACKFLMIKPSKQIEVTFTPEGGDLVTLPISEIFCLETPISNWNMTNTDLVNADVHFFQGS